MVAMRPLLIAALVGLAFGQYEGWEPNQFETKMCYWDSPRVAVIRDTLWLDGGDLVWWPTISNKQSQPIMNNNPGGLMYSFNFSKPFNVKDNITRLIETMPNNGLSPNMIDGALLYNDAEFLLYGGLINMRLAGQETPDGDRASLWRFFSYGADKPGFKRGGTTWTLDNNVTRYVAFGGSASAPSENKAWYLGGLRSPLSGEIFRTSANKSLLANTSSDALITFDMKTQMFEKISKETLPSSIKPRANPSVVWVPVGSEGILVVLGGVTYPEVANYVLRESTNPALSKEESPEFMQKIDVYDVASKKWYQQEAKDGPGALTRGCAVLGTAQDKSSFNIYYYGGYPGIDGETDFSDDVWVLSLPSFQWTRVYVGEQIFARAGHQCVTPYPDQMMVVGGYAALGGTGYPACIPEFFRVFNLSSAAWQDGYNPSVWSEYAVPAAVQRKIGGNEKGSATATAPVVSGWADPSLESVFATPYETSKIKTWYPYAEAKATDRPPTGDGDNGGGGGGGGTPKWVAPVLGVVLGLVFITAILVGVCLWRRRKVLRRGNGTATATDDNGSRIISWMRGQPSEPAKAPTVTTEEASTLDMAEVRTPPPAPAAAPAPAPFVAHEMADDHIAELPDTSRPPELHGVGLTPIEIINKHTHFGTPSNPATTNQSSYYASVSSNENASSLSRSSGVLGYQTRAQSPSPEPNPPSPQITDSTSKGRVGSDVSGLSDQDSRHLRHISQATVSSASSGGEQELLGAHHGGRGVPATVPETPTPGQPSPLSPPTGASDGEDYISARMMPVSPAGTGTLRRSMFHESEDDLGSRK